MVRIPNSVSYCRAEPFRVSAAAPRPRKKGRFRVAISDRLPEIGTGAPTSQYASDTVRISDGVPAGGVGWVLWLTSVEVRTHDNESHTPFHG